MNSFRPINILTAALAMLLALSANASDKVPDLLTILSNAKAQAEGRATRVQNCSSLKGHRVLEDLTSKYDDAKNPYNGRIDAWLFLLRNRRTIDANTALEPEKMDIAFAKTREFIESADKALVKAGCPTKASWKQVLETVIAVAPPAAEALSWLLKGNDAQEKEREELIKALEQRKMKDWANIRVIVVFDWSTKEFLDSETMTFGTLRKGSTSIYVNKWAVWGDLDAQFATDRMPPELLQNTHFLYTGRIKDLKVAVGGIRFRACKDEENSSMAAGVACDEPQTR